VKPAVSESPGHSIDLAPTILAATRLTPTPNMSGLNLLDWEAVAKREALYGEIFLHTAVDIRKTGPNLRFRWIIHGPWKLIVPDAANEPKAIAELYDLSKDENETKNLAAMFPDRVQDLTRKLDAWWKP